MLICGIAALIGYSIQNIFHGWWVGGPSVALSLLFIYVNAQNRRITTDSLTGLNNRGEFDAQLKKKAETEADGAWGLLLLDVDDFKQINDTLGHAVGDEALWQTADILRHTFGKGRAFLARYGGDEFVIMGNWKNHEEAEQAICEIEQGSRTFNQTMGKEYQLSFSVGYALWSETRDVEALVVKADERMYEKKCKKRKHTAARDMN